jgi:Domain of unknown function (DUF4189)
VRRLGFLGLSVCLGMVLICGTISAAHAQGAGCYISGYDPDPYDSASQPIWECPNGNRPHPPEFTGTWYAAIAKSSATPAWGASWHENSQQAAERDALTNCRKGGHDDCKVAIAGANNCLSLAISIPDGAWGSAASDMDRSGAVSTATNSCRKYGGKNCRVVVTPCGRNSPDTPPCIREYSNDISRGEAWAHMSPEQKKLWNKPPNGGCNKAIT